MSVAVRYVASHNEWNEGAWGEILGAFGLRRAEETPEMVKVLIQPQSGRWVQGEVPLPEFKHPEHAVYIFGPDDGHLSPEIEGEYDHKVYIPQLHTNVTLYAHQAAGIVLYDRMVKHGDC